MRLAKKLLLCMVALIISGIILYADLLFSFPTEITMFKNEAHNPSLGAGVFVGDIPQSISVWDSENGIIPLENGEYDAALKIANTLPFRKIRVRVTSSYSVNASGQLIGLRIFNKGLIVTETSSIQSGGKACSPAKDAGIIPGDIILEINGTGVSSTEDVSSQLTKSTTITLLRNNTLKKVTVSPVKDDSDGIFKLGIWVRDSTAGVGTLTYYDTKTGMYGALGHPVSDSDTGVLFNVERGNIECSSVISVKKGTSGSAGEIRGSFSSQKTPVGTVEKNCGVGIFGKITSESGLIGKSYPIGVMSQVTEGPATILSTVDDGVKEYEIKIIRSMPFGSATKGLMIEITDPELLLKAGGIVQGMSGSPIIQNGKIIGAVTHVLVNDPTRGYGIFIENMLAEAEKISG